MAALKCSAALAFAAVLRGVSAARRSPADDSLALSSPEGGCEFPCGAESVMKDNITFTIGEGSGISFEVKENYCLQSCEVVESKMLGTRKGCDAVLPGSTKVSKNRSSKLCCTTWACPTTTKTTSQSPAAPLAAKFACQTGQGPAFASYEANGQNSFEGCAALCDADEACRAFDYTEALSTHPELISLNPTFAKQDSCRLYKTAKLRQDGGREIRSFCSKVGVEEEDFEVEYLAGSSSSGCNHPCGTNAVTVGEAHFKIGSGKGIDYMASPDTCLGDCAVVRSASFFSASCSTVLPGSKEVSKNDNSKLCCVSDMCPSTTTTTTELELDLEEKFSCQAGQGGAFRSYHMTGDNSFEACAALCNAEEDCQGFDFTASDSQHPELLSLHPTVAKKDACRLYRANKPRLGDAGSADRQYCEKKIEWGEAVDDETDDEAVKREDKHGEDAVDETDDEDAVIMRQVSSGCQHGCGSTSVTVNGTIFEIGSGSGITYKASSETCLGACIVASPGMLSSSSCSTVLPGSEKVAKNGSSKLCCLSEACPSTSTTTTTPSAATRLAQKFACQTGQGQPFKTYMETVSNSFEGCASLCDLEDQCEGFDFTVKKTTHPELFSVTPNVLKPDSCRLYKANKPRLGDPGTSGRQYCQKIP
eukprot:TRINITY_DN5593_c0_g1_i7.p1 TRINITY_DN5593_c0_g1~~TRINITY_DN5593_c0_g1_i7.p1  ORF type:complete len:647 (+),score=118.36 TRINITY_DN5593_c0_g1_i7:68-2008(+)